MATQNINVGKGLNPEIELFGDWNKALRMFDQLPVAVNTGYELGSVRVANDIRRIVRKNIKSNGPPGVHWPALSLAYQQFKKRKGGDTNKMWNFKGTYYKNIKVIHKKGAIYVGVPAYKRGTVHKSKNLTLGQIANILERGSAESGIRARPLWKPSFKEFGGKPKTQKVIVRAIRDHVFLLTGVRPRITF